MPRFDVTVAGELNLDLILYGLPSELAPERELLAENMILTLGSSSAILAHNLAALGSRVGFQGLLGEDSLGEIALDRLRAAGVDVSRVEKEPAPAKSALTVILQRENWRNMLTYLGPMARFSLRHIDFDYLADSRHFHLSSLYLQKGLQPHLPELFRRLHSAGLTISLDTNDDPDDAWDGGLRDILRHVDVFLPNAREAKKIAGTEDLEIAVQRLTELVPLVVVKLGDRGALAQRGAERVSSPAIAAEVVDAVGAGDSFDAGFLHQYLRGADFSACLTYGNLAGAFSTTRPGGTEAFRDRRYKDEFFRSKLAPPAQANS